MENKSPHKDQPVFSGGVLEEKANFALICLHGRGSSAYDILRFSESLEIPYITLKAPEASGNTWYPQRFTEPRSHNEPYLSSALDLVEKTSGDLEKSGFKRENIFILGFSQGACLALEYSARLKTPLGGVFALSGGLIGSDEEMGDYSGDLKGQPVFIGCGDSDSHIPLKRVETTYQIFKDLNGAVDTRVYQGMGHAINDDEIEYIKEFFNKLQDFSL